MTATPPVLVHATAVSIDGDGVLLLGPSGAGKSDLALRLIDGGALLVADDQVALTELDGSLWAAAPAVLAGLLEIRGVGIRRMPSAFSAILRLAIELVPAERVDRLPDPAEVSYAGVALPLLRLAAFEASTPAKIRWALGAVPDGPRGARSGASGVVPSVGYKDIAMSEPVSLLPSLPNRAVAGPNGAGPNGAGSESARVLMITGMSGAGRSSCLKILEDIGYEAVDNLPLSLLPPLISMPCAADRSVAVGIDIRTRDFGVAPLVAEIDKLARARGIDARLIFLDCDDESLARRYTETRRRHPLAGDRPVMDGIRLERERVSPLRERADLVIDTSALRPADLKRLLHGNFALNDQPGLALFVTSFSFRHGLPREADMVFDVRFLDNPYYDPALRPLTGRDPAVAAHVAADPSFPGFFGGLTGLLQPLLPRFDGEGKSYLTIAVGCTGGRHRSVFVAEHLGQWLRQQGQRVTVDHRDVDRPVSPPPAESPAGPVFARSDA
ncbi:MAG TPA: RNase adapter RapZ [Stellaceae bacterium]|nr:RNase adapter RapZ [Stellaceae bacterium]